jgi:hypothetical protein
VARSRHGSSRANEIALLQGDARVAQDPVRGREMEEEALGSKAGAWSRALPEARDLENASRSIDPACRTPRAFASAAALRRTRP